MLIDLDAQDGREGFKGSLFSKNISNYFFTLPVVDFEKCFYGPCGLDLGLFLSNYLYYYAAHPYPINRRSLSGGVAAVMESYRSAFIIQVLGVAKEKQIDIDAESLWNEVYS